MREGREPGLMYVIAWGCNQYAPTPGNVPKHHTSLSSVNTHETTLWVKNEQNLKKKKTPTQCLK